MTTQHNPDYRSNENENTGYTDYDRDIAIMADEGCGGAITSRGNDTRDHYPLQQEMIADEDGMGAAIR